VRASNDIITVDDNSDPTADNDCPPTAIVDPTGDDTYIMFPQIKIIDDVPIS